VVAIGGIEHLQTIDLAALPVGHRRGLRIRSGAPDRCIGIQLLEHAGSGRVILALDQRVIVAGAYRQRCRRRGIDHFAVERSGLLRLTTRQIGVGHRPLGVGRHDDRLVPQGQVAGNHVVETIHLTQHDQAIDTGSLASLASRWEMLEIGIQRCERCGQRRVARCIALPPLEACLLLDAVTDLRRRDIGAETCLRRRRPVRLLLLTQLFGTTMGTQIGQAGNLRLDGLRVVRRVRQHPLGKAQCGHRMPLLPLTFRDTG